MVLGLSLHTSSWSAQPTTSTFKMSPQLFHLLPVHPPLASWLILSPGPQLFCLFPLWPRSTYLSPERNTCFHPLLQSIQCMLRAFRIKPKLCWTYKILHGPAPAYLHEPHLLSHSSFATHTHTSHLARTVADHADQQSALTTSPPTTLSLHPISFSSGTHHLSFFLLSVFPY